MRFLLRNEGTISLLNPVDKEAEDWVEAHLSDDAQTWGGSVVIEHRFVQDIVNGIKQDGGIVL